MELDAFPRDHELNSQVAREDRGLSDRTITTYIYGYIRWLESFSAAAETFTRWTTVFYAVFKQRIHYKLAVYSDIQDSSYINARLPVSDLISARTSGNRMSLLSPSHRSCMAVPSTRTTSASRAVSVCTQWFGTVYQNPCNRATVFKT